jgi:hypothetical protein
MQNEKFAILFSERQLVMAKKHCIINDDKPLKASTILDRLELMNKIRTRAGRISILRNMERQLDAIEKKINESKKAKS